MAAKNPFKKHASILLKSKNGFNGLTIERHENTYYIADGFTMLKIESPFYEVYFKPVSELYITLEDNYQIKYKVGYAPILGRGDSLKHCFEHFYPHENVSNVEFTSVIVSCANGLVRIAKIHNKIAAFNNDFYEAVLSYARAFSPLTFISNGILNGAYFTCEDKIIEGLIMPIRPDNVINVLRNIMYANNI